VTPSPFFYNSSKDKLRPASFLFDIGKRKKFPTPDWFIKMVDHQDTNDIRLHTSVLQRKKVCISDVFLKKG
jgi:hypothetical protein